MCDFGLSRIRHEITRTKTLFHPGLSARYAAPELPNLHDASFRTTEAADIYSLSMTIFHLGTLEQPYNHIGEDAGVRAAAQAGKRPEPPRESSNLNRELWGMLGGMWAHKPNKRLTIDQVAMTLGLPTHHGTLPSLSMTALDLILPQHNQVHLFSTTGPDCSPARTCIYSRSSTSGSQSVLPCTHTAT